jgi:hypothetical protein
MGPGSHFDNPQERKHVHQRANLKKVNPAPFRRHFAAISPRRHPDRNYSGQGGAGFYAAVETAF